MLSSVDLPQPDGPMIETNSPGLTLIEAFVTASTGAVDRLEAQREVA